jgi:hypothetical protein
VERAVPLLRTVSAAEAYKNLCEIAKAVVFAFAIAPASIAAAVVIAAAATYAADVTDRDTVAASLVAVTAITFWIRGRIGTA